LFKKTFLRYVKILGLTDYQVYFKHEYIQEAFATLENYEPGKIITVKMTTELYGFDAKVFNPVTSAKHEAVHLLLARIQYLAGNRYVTESSIDEEIEGLVRKLEVLL